MKIKNAVVACVLAFATGLVHAEPKYSITALGSLGSGFSYGYDINNNGTIVGFSQVVYQQSSLSAFQYSNGVMTALGLDGNSIAYGMNDSGMIVGQGWNPDNQREEAFRYDSGNITFAADSQTGTTMSYARAINDSGHSVGATSSWEYPALSNNIGHVQTLGLKDEEGMTYRMPGEATDINNKGQVTGTFVLGGNIYHAFLYSEDVFVDLGSIGGGVSAGSAINSFGQVAGTSHISGDIHNAFLYSNGIMTNLGSLDGGYSYAEGLNDLGQVVGGSGMRGYLYTAGTMYDLNLLVAPGSGWTIWGANDINNLGQIVANGCSDTYGCQALLLNPVPEPETYAMMLAGLGLIGVMARRRKQKLNA